VDLESRLGQLELIIFPPLASILHPIPLFVAEFFVFRLDLCVTSVPLVVPIQQDCDWMRGGRGLERVLCRVVDQDLRVDLLAGLEGILLEPTIPDFLWVHTSALVILVMSSCPFANVVSWDCPVQITVSNIPEPLHVVAIRSQTKCHSPGK